MPLSISSLSVETIAVCVKITENGITIDPTGHSVQVAVRPNQQPPEMSHWKPASWEALGGKDFAKIDVGPGTDIGALTPGIYEVWVKILAPPRTPISKVSSRLTIY